ncbi:hypothetical protein FHS38_005758 [Streptomyces netropsis]|uniref:Uncharacterized protein n=1 Tax=Streptomyces netropsis TaxID=55404 RepID=A0A7W7PH80_STRNE|nr:hypothetical protein [Streptomyces netropsis]MBB4889682.1 hypothetical protein [Streptomyces netropsis]
MIHTRHTSGREELASIGELLARADVLTAQFDDYDEEAALRRIAARVVLDRANALDRHARAIRHGLGGGRWTPPDGLPHGQRTALHARAADELGALSSRVAHDRSAIASMALLVDDPARIEPVGALTFACLLHLADRQEGAVFWWQFAAGAESATAAHCLYLHHLRHSERDAARHWFTQATELHGQGGDVFPGEAPTRVKGDTPPSRYGASDTDPRPSWGEGSDRPAGGTQVYPPGAPWRTNTTHLTDAVRRLEAGSDTDFGAIPRPAPGLAAELKDTTPPIRPRPAALDGLPTGTHF